MRAIFFCILYIPHKKKHQKDVRVPHFPKQHICKIKGCILVPEKAAARGDNWVGKTASVPWEVPSPAVLPPLHPVNPPRRNRHILRKIEL